MNSPGNSSNDKQTPKKGNPKPIKRIPRSSPRQDRFDLLLHKQQSEAPPPAANDSSFHDEASTDIKKVPVTSEIPVEPAPESGFRYAAAGHFARKPSKREIARRRKRWLILLTVLVILGGGAYFLFTNQNLSTSPGALASNEQVATSPAAPENNDELFTETIKVDPDDSTNAVTPKEPAVSEERPQQQNLPVAQTSQTERPNAALRAEILAWFENYQANEPLEVETKISKFVGFIMEKAELSGLDYLTAIKIALANISTDLEVAQQAVKDLKPLFDAAYADLSDTQASARYHYLAGQAKILSGAINGAVQDLELSLQLDPSSELSLRALYSLYTMRGNTSKQLEIGRKLLAFVTDNGRMLSELVQVLAAAERNQEALDLLDSYPQLVLSDSGLAIQKAQLQAASGIENTQILREFKQVIQKFPDDIKARVFYLVLLDNVGEEFEINKQLARLIADLESESYLDDPIRDRYAIVAASLSWKYGSEETAEDIYRRIMESDDDMAAVAANDLAYKLAVKGERIEEAEQLAKYAHNKFPQQLSYIDTMAKIHLLRGRPAEAVEVFEQNTNVDGLNHPLAIRTLIDAYEQTGQLQKAAQLKANLPAAEQ